MVYCDDTCVRGVLNLVQYTHIKYVAGASEIDESAACVAKFCVRALVVCVCVRACVCKAGMRS